MREVAPGDGASIRLLTRLPAFTLQVYSVQCAVLSVVSIVKFVTCSKQCKSNCWKSEGQCGKTVPRQSHERTVISLCPKDFQQLLRRYQIHEVNWQMKLVFTLYYSTLWPLTLHYGFNTRYHVPELLKRTDTRTHVRTKFSRICTNLNFKTRNLQNRLFFIFLTQFD